MATVFSDAERDAIERFDKRWNEIADDVIGTPLWEELRLEGEAAKAVFAKYSSESGKLT